MVFIVITYPGSQVQARPGATDIIKESNSLLFKSISLKSQLLEIRSGPGVQSFPMKSGLMFQQITIEPRLPSGGQA